MSQIIREDIVALCEEFLARRKIPVDANRSAKLGVGYVAFKYRLSNQERECAYLCSAEGIVNLGVFIGPQLSGGAQYCFVRGLSHLPALGRVAPVDSEFMLIEWVTSKEAKTFALDPSSMMDFMFQKAERDLPCVDAVYLAARGRPTLQRIVNLAGSVSPQSGRA